MLIDITKKGNWWRWYIFSTKRQTREGLRSCLACGIAKDEQEATQRATFKAQLLKSAGIE